MKKYLVGTVLLLAMISSMGATCAGTMQSVATGPDGKPLLDANGGPVILTHEVDYFASVAMSNEAQARNPRVATLILQPTDPSKPAVLENASLVATIPLDAHKLPINPDSYGKQVGQAAEKLTPLGVVVAVGDTLKSTVPAAGTRNTSIQQSSTGDLSPVSAPGGNMGNLGGTLTTPAPVIVPPVITGGE